MSELAMALMSVGLAATGVGLVVGLLAVAVGAGRVWTEYQVARMQTGIDLARVKIDERAIELEHGAAKLADAVGWAEIEQDGTAEDLEYDPVAIGFPRLRRRGLYRVK